MSNANPFSGISAVNPFSSLGQGPPIQPVQTNYGVIPSGTPNVGDLFASLRECQWRQIGFPVARLMTELVQSQVIHKFADRDSAHIEPQGRHPLRFTAKIPLLNYIRRGKNESWPVGRLYPAVWRSLFAACADRSSGLFQHPELGLITCKCENARTEWSAEVQGGVFVDISWIESDDTTTDLRDALSTPSPAASVYASASAIDAALSGTNPITAPVTYVPTISFTDLANAVRGVIDQGTLVQKEAAGRIQNLITQANALETSLSMAANALHWPFFQMAEELKASCIVLQGQLLNDSTKKIGFFTVQKDSTLAQVALTSGQTIDSIMQLNPGYIGPGIVPALTAIRIYNS